jgi:DNA-binding transcriptional LysR family regulator
MIGNAHMNLPSRSFGGREAAEQQMDLHPLPAYLQVMDWSDLPFFLAVARAGQISRAAAAMHTDPTTVGRRIRRLEQALSVRLFEQDAQGQSLTAAGIDLLARVEAMSEIASDIGKDSGDQDVRGTIRVSVAEGFGTWFISRHLGALADRYPGLEVDLVANSGFLNPSRRETDLAVLLARPRRGPLITRKLTDYRLNLYAASAYLEQRGAIAVPGDLSGHRLIGYIPDIIYAPELRYWEDMPIQSVAHLRSSSINAQHQLIASGAGVGVLPRFIGDMDHSLTAVLPEISIIRSFWLVTHRETRAFGPVRLFGEWLTALVREHRDLF